MRVTRRGRRSLAVVGIVMAAVGLTACDPPAKELYDAACAGTLQATTSGTLPSPPIAEASGLAASPTNDDTFWVHNDSGDSPRVFAVTGGGTLRATVNVTNATAVDWEAMAIGKPLAPGGPSRIFLGDIGDNAKARASIVVYRLDEPSLPPSPGTFGVTADKLTFVYPDGPRDAEALFVHSGLNRIFIIEKLLSGGKAGLYSAPATVAAGSTTTLTKVATVPFPLGLGGIVTDASMSSDGGLLLVRTYGAVRLYRAEGRTPAVALKSTVCFGPVPAEIQGETIALAKDNRSYVTVSEGSAQPIHRAARP